MAPSRVKSLISEARRRRFFGTLALYFLGAWGALQAADLLFPGWGVPESAIRYVWIGAVLALPLAVIFGWYYDVTAQGIRRTPARAGETHRDLSRSDLVVLSMLVLVCAGLIAAMVARIVDVRTAEQMHFAAPDAPENSIAVLPFVNMSEDNANEYFSDGITEQLLNELSRLPDLHVAARTSSFYYKNRNAPMQEVGRALGVRTLLEGSVRKSGDTVRITAQLIDAEDGYHLWSEVYDRELDDVFAVQDEIAQAITKALEIERFVAKQRRLDRGGTDNAQAYDHFLRGMAHRQMRTVEAVDRAAEYFEKALELDPDFALALDALAYGYILRTYNGSMRIDEASRLAEPLILRALELEPGLEQAHATLALLDSRAGRYDEANAGFEKALEINPNYFQGQVNYGLSLVHQSRLKEASAAYLRALALDPLNANLNFNLSGLMMLLGQFEDGYDFIEKSLAILPGRPIVMSAKTHWLGQYGRLADAVSNGLSVQAEHPAATFNVAALVRAYTMLGMRAEAERLLTESESAMTEAGSYRLARQDFALHTGDRESFIAIAAEDFRQLDKRMGDQLDVDQGFVVRQYGHALLLQGRARDAAEHLYWAMGGEDGLGDITYDQMNVVKLLALAYRRQDRDEDAARLLDRCLDLVVAARESGWATPVLHVRLAEILAARGDPDEAIAQLAVAVDKGFRDLGWLEYGIFWQDMQDHPGFDAIKLRIIEFISAERALLERPAETA